MESADPNYVEVYRARNLPQAHSIRLALEQSGIRVQIEGELLQGAVGDLPLGWATAPRILVKESQIIEAREIIEKAENQEEARSDEDEENDEATRCLACGKVLPEGQARCRSCGWSYQDGEDAAQQAAITETTTEDAASVGSQTENSQHNQVVPPLTGRQLWWEVLAVLTIGVFPHFNSVFVAALVSWPKRPYWVDSVALAFQSGCITFAVLYLIYRSGESWATFGIKRPGVGDIPLGILVYLVGVCIGWFLESFPSRNIRNPDELFPTPLRATDYLFMVAKYSASAFTEELVTRAYLITRLERVLRSHTKAVMLSAALYGSYHLYYGVLLNVVAEL